MKLIVGLGNPGPQYQDSRHNAGVLVVEALARQAGLSIDGKRFKGRFVRGTIAGEPCGLLLPLTYMNASGESVGPAARFFKIAPESILIVHDELDLSPGTFRLKEGGGLAGHNGLKSVASHLSSKAFLRLRFGIGRPPPPQEVVSYVLSNFPASDLSLQEQTIDSCTEAIEFLLKEGIGPAMNHFHSGRRKA